MSSIGRPFDAVVFAWGNWSADGRYFAHGTPAGVEIWNFDTDTWPDLACRLAGRNLTETEWEQDDPRTLERRATCPQYPL